MSAGFQPLDASQLEAISKLPDVPAKKSRGPKKDATEPRDIMTWMKLYHHFQRDCEVSRHEEANHVDPNKPNEPVSRTRATAVINEVAVCRYCFLAETDKIGRSV